MRDIKFRGLIEGIEENKWIYGYYFEDGDKESNIQEFITEEVAAVKYETVGQYTGLKDKNDKEIYEGDIIQFVWEEDSCWGKAGTYKGYIGFNQGAFEVIYIGRDEITVFDDGGWHENSKSDDMQSFISWSEEIEVIGNIYENPNLLKESCQ